MRTVNATYARKNLSALLAAVEAGETVIITKHGRPVARLEPGAESAQQERERKFGEMIKTAAAAGEYDWDITLEEARST